MNHREPRSAPLVGLFLALGRLAAAALLFLAAPLMSQGLSAQHERAPAPVAYALEDVTVTRADGSRVEGATVVVRRGLVESLEPGTDVPPDARVLEGENLHLYPGLVDSRGQASFDFPSGPERREVLPWNPSRSDQGFTPHLRVADHLTATGASVRDQRQKGIVAMGVHPTGGIAPGIGAVLLLRKGAEHPRELIFGPELGLSLSFIPARRAYPSTHFGVVAHLRQSFQDAERQDRIRSEYARDPLGLRAPGWDPDLAVLQAVAAGEMRVFFEAHGAESLRQVLRLSDDFGFRPVIVGGGEAWRVAEELADRNVPVLVSLDFPDPVRWTPPDEAEPDPEAQPPPGRTEEELKPAALREKERLENLYANPGRLAEAGVVFALTSGGGIADLREGTRKAIEYGLAEGDALDALTRTPAALLGVPAVSRLEEGMAATFLVTDGPLFDDETRVLYTFVDGGLEEAQRDPEGSREEEPGGSRSGAEDAEDEEGGAR